MKVTSEQFKTKAENQYGAVYKIRALVDGAEITDEIQDFEYSSMANPDGEFTFGNTCASQVNFKIDTPSQNLTDKELVIQQGIDIDGTVEYINIGVFKVLKPENSRSVYTYQCVDRMISKMEMPYFSELTYPTTDVAVLNEICTQVGISLDNADSLISHTLQSAPSGYTRREIIGYMAQLQGKNAIINGNGNLELKWYNNADYIIDDDRIYLDGSDSIKDESNYILGYIECSVSTSSDEEIKTIKSGTGNIGIKTENPFMTQEILDEVFSVIGGFTFMPVEVQFLGDFRLEVGDIVTVETYGKTYQVPIMQLNHSSDGGVVTTIESVAETDSENEISFTNPITKQMERYYAELVLINKALVNKLGVEELDAAKAEIEQAIIVSLDTQYAKIDFANIDTAKVDKNIVSLLLAEVGLIDRATIVEGHVTKLLDAVEINANSIKSGTIVTDRLLLSGAEGSILFELNNLGELTSTNVDSLDGYVITPRTINADRIVAGSITANEIDVQNLFAQDITATGTIRGATFIGGDLSSNVWRVDPDTNWTTVGCYFDLTNGWMYAPCIEWTDTSVKMKNLYIEDGFVTTYTRNYNEDGEVYSVKYVLEIDDAGITEIPDINQTVNRFMNLNADRIQISDGDKNLSFNYTHTLGLNLNNTSDFYGEARFHNGIIANTLLVRDTTTLQGTLDVTGATTLESTLNVKDTASFDKPLNLSSDGLAMNMNGVSGNILNYSATNNAFYLLGTENISNFVVSLGNTSAKEIQMRARVKFYTETYSSFIFNNGTNTYFLLSYDNAEDFNNLRPLTIQNSTGYITAIGAFATDLKPSATDTYNLGTSTSLRFNNIYAKTSTIASSDENAKKDIEELNDKYNKLYDKLIPVSYRFKDGERVHLGFISQRVQEAMNEVGLTDMDFAGFCRDKVQEEVVAQKAIYDENGNMLKDVVTEMVDVLDENGNVQYTYGLRYEEFIALNTNQIQKLKTRVNALEEENRELKETINNVLLRLQVLEERG